MALNRFDLVLVLRAETSTLFDRLKARYYTSSCHQFLCDRAFVFGVLLVGDHDVDDDVVDDVDDVYDYDHGGDVDDSNDVDDDAGGTARRRLGRMWSARSCRWCWRRLRRPTPRKRCTKFRAIPSRSSSPTPSAWYNGWKTGDVTTTRAHDTNSNFEYCCVRASKRGLVCIYEMPVVVVLYGYLDFSACFAPHLGGRQRGRHVVVQHCCASYPIPSAAPTAR